GKWRGWLATAARVDWTGEEESRRLMSHQCAADNRERTEAHRNDQTGTGRRGTEMRRDNGTPSPPAPPAETTEKAAGDPQRRSTGRLSPAEVALLEAMIAEAEAMRRRLTGVRDPEPVPISSLTPDP